MPIGTLEAIQQGGLVLYACLKAFLPLPSLEAVSYTHLTLPTNREVEISVVAVVLKKKKKRSNNSIAGGN